MTITNSLNHTLAGKRAPRLTLFIALTLSLLATPIAAQALSITVYPDCNFAGQAVSLPPGAYDLAELNRRGIRNDAVSAVRVPAGLKITLYEHAGFRGRTLVLTTDNRCLTNARFNDLTSSIRVELIRAPYATSARPPPTAAPRATLESAPLESSAERAAPPVTATPRVLTPTEVPRVAARPPTATEERALVTRAAPPPPPPTGTPRVAMSATPRTSVDDILAAMTTANIAFNTPNTINVQETAQIQLLLSLQKSIEELTAALTAEGVRAGETVKVSNRMEARLTGPNFQITAITPEEQAISATENTEWRWEIKPTIAGQHNLHLTLTALINVEGTNTRRSIRTFDRIIEVEVTPGQMAWEFFKKYWQWLWAVVLVPIVGWVWKKLKDKT